MKKFFNRLIMGGVAILILVGGVVGILALFSWNFMVGMVLSFVVSAYWFGKQMEEYEIRKEAEKKIREMQDREI